ncbi:gluconate 2-dehydrogenase subunit 3 family protein [Haloferax sp. MBLA0076]|uniref:Gluconate 2-dehydrogenase subunit 3 family protein n=1 Tax=Haloferax litoreum TaxID=2666140 RepID=A0A6A8GII1_9EURY|nr:MULTISPECIES: gluconate 2-dehydrogenase subunit 3 family protein [Haloferax]KAB1194481.1 gluconate 2-dehydrogenase subunit 3 family protein [Haloferax sp. CBA1148]MRX23048.1 gluconate 2-dehydrogenase subunit 3 family protein [Haloferax litoreum]
MRLTRRDALTVLAGMGIVGGGAVAADRFTPPTADDQSAETGDDGGPATDVLPTMVAVAEVVYPSEATGVPEFVETYVFGRVRDDERDSQMHAAAAELDGVARDWYDAPFFDLPTDERDSLLRELGVDTADPVPDGTISERLRFHVVNELLYAFYASPTGGRLVGIENPIGHPGGTESYRRATMETLAAEGERDDE